MTTFSHLNTAQEILLAPSGLTLTHVYSVLESMLTRQIDMADLYFQESHSESWFLENGIVRDAGYDFERGVGVRAICGEKTGYAYSNDIDLEALREAAYMSRNIAQKKGTGRIKVPTRVNGLNLYPPINPLDTLSAEKKVSLLQEIDREARKHDPRVTQVMANLSGSYDVILIVASDGTLAADIRPLVYLSVSVIVSDKGRQETGGYGGGLRGEYQCFLQKGVAQRFAIKAVRQALIKLKAVKAPAGLMPVVLGPGWTGVLLHETVGHGLEGDHIRKETSAFLGRLGKKVASPLCTIVDNGTLKKRRGSLNIDDEGTPTRENILIENGILVNYLQDKLNARLMKRPLTGNGRREAYDHAPLPRMTNTYMLPGKYDPREIIKSVKKGIYAVDLSGGEVDTTSGKFVFSVNKAYLIENGKITYPVKGATLIGSGPEVLTKVSMVGNNLRLDSGIGMCGKDGQSVPVGVGQPTVKVDELIVGGTS